MVGTWCRSGFGRLKKTVRRSRPLMFVNELMHQPKFTGAICPSSRKLGRYMAKHIPLNHDGIVIELGGGTGVITQAILDHGVPADKLIVIEDRKSTRLNSSHVKISYAVFCLKK